MGKAAILIIAAIVTASTQCIAACSVLPCGEVPQRQSSTPASADCHHQAPPADHGHQKTNCGHPELLSDAIPQAASVNLDAAVIASVELNFVEVVPEPPVLFDFASDRSPPLPFDIPAFTILQV